MRLPQHVMVRHREIVRDFFIANVLEFRRRLLRLMPQAVAPDLRDHLSRSLAGLMPLFRLATLERDTRESCRSDNSVVPDTPRRGDNAQRFTQLSQRTRYSPELTEPTSTGGIQSA